MRRSATSKNPRSPPQSALRNTAPRSSTSRQHPVLSPTAHGLSLRHKGKPYQVEINRSGSFRGKAQAPTPGTFLIARSGHAPGLQRPHPARPALHLLRGGPDERLGSSRAGASSRGATLSASPPPAA